MQIPKSLPEFYTGSPVDAPDLRYRSAFLDDLWDTLEAKHVLLTAPRRTGKTSIMDHLRAFPKSGYAVVYENVQDLDHPAEFFAALLSRFYDEHPKVFRDTLGKSWDLVKIALGKIKEIGISEFKVALRESDPDWRAKWKLHGERFLQQVRKHDTPILLIVDELPDMLLNLKGGDPELLREFLAWFRTQRQNPKPKQDKVRWLIGGSVNLSSTLDSVGMVDLINDLEDVPLPVLTVEEVMDFVSTMLTERGVGLDPGVPARLAARLGRPIPLFMQMITQDLYRRWKKRERALGVADVDAAFADLVISNAARDKLQHYYSRIARYYDGSKVSAAHTLLSRLSLSDGGLSRSRLLQDFEQILAAEGVAWPAHQRKQQFNQLLRDLENDFYVAEITADQFDFASGILKSWWKKYYA
ncbi:MAG: ATP-binding protein [Verrucomicrobiales bacterium]|nr:ATP-binding protein [Verrucomicrobiales bacterium]